MTVEAERDRQSRIIGTPRDMMLLEELPRHQRQRGRAPFRTQETLRVRAEPRCPSRLPRIVLEMILFHGLPRNAVKGLK